MKKDIFIDNNIACRFNNPMDPEIKRLIKWLLQNNKNEKKEDNAYLIVSTKLKGEYNRSCLNNFRDTSIHVIISALTIEGRLINVDNKKIKSFKKTYFTKAIKRSLKSNQKDWEHIPVVLLSDRKIALAFDNNFINDINSFPGFKGKASKRPSELNYSS